MLQVMKMMIRNIGIFTAAYLYRRHIYINVISIDVILIIRIIWMPISTVTRITVYTYHIYNPIMTIRFYDLIMTIRFYGVLAEFYLVQLSYIGLAIVIRRLEIFNPLPIIHIHPYLKLRLWDWVVL